MKTSLLVGGGRDTETTVSVATGQRIYGRIIVYTPTYGGNSYPCYHLVKL